MLINNVSATTAAIITFSKNQNFPSNDVFYFFARDGIMLHKLALAATKHNVVHLR